MLVTPSEIPTPFTLYIFDKNYSSWSMRIYSLFAKFRIPVNVICYEMDRGGPLFDEWKQSEMFNISTTVPVLKDEEVGITVNESLALAEYIAERFPQKHLWPENVKLRALARSLASEMHAGFKYLRYNLGFNYRAIYTPAPKVASSPECVVEVRRLLELWTKARTLTKEVLADGGDEGYLFGRYSVPDSFFWPPLCRFRTYRVDYEKIAQDASIEETGRPGKYDLALQWIKHMWNDDTLKKLGKEMIDAPQCVGQFDNLYREEGCVMGKLVEHFSRL
ncbi:hypothetical protein BOTBODRAFT_52943 [Botryobasidium botryosum FD-172 SS1]|uniref:GST N-terminal domain-containing protein n=1 Tax=Botryobasidium botryosum (strain FD-172 SS1) TaxID=930990 RepID=A0A067MQY2_BOTB1|nr:hypothetical protein BOTBODRAFT_52943 [Botryobasidium botryosum FD-172 SS1]